MRALCSTTQDATPRGTVHFASSLVRALTRRLDKMLVQTVDMLGEVVMSADGGADVDVVGGAALGGQSSSAGTRASSPQ